MKAKLMPMLYANGCPYGVYVTNEEYRCENAANKTGKCWCGENAWNETCIKSNFPPQCPLTDCEMDEK